MDFPIISYENKKAYYYRKHALSKTCIVENNEEVNLST